MKKIYFAIITIAVMLCGVSCVKDQMYQGPATISEVNFTPGSVQPWDEVTVTATISDLRSIKSAIVKYTVNGTQATVAMSNSGEKYTGVIPQQADKAEVNFTVEAVNELGFTTTSDVKKYTVAIGAIDYTKLRLNELNGNDKFMEIYNTGTTPIPLEGIYIEKDGVTNWTCDARTLGKDEYLLLYSEDVTADHPEQPAALIFHSGLSAKKNVRIQLFTPAGISIDDFNLTAIAKTAKASYSRNDDGKWYHTDATPGAKNIQGSDPVEGLE